MINIDDLLDNIVLGYYDENDGFALQYANLYSAYSDHLPAKINNGGRFLKMECDDYTYQELLLRAKKIKGEDNKYEFYWGELPKFRNRYHLKKFGKEENTLRVYNYGNKEYAEFFDKKKKYNYIIIDDGKCLVVKPVRWIIDDIAKGIISDQVYECNEKQLKQYINQPKIIEGEPINVCNSFFNIENGVINRCRIRNYRFKGYFRGTFFPLGIKMMKNGAAIKPLSHFSSDWYSNDVGADVIFPKSTEEIIGHYCLALVELYDNIKIKGDIIISDYDGILEDCHYFYDPKLNVHYESYTTLHKFLSNYSDKISLKISSKDAKFKCTIYGPRLTKEEISVVRSYELFKNFEWVKEKPLKYNKETYFETNDKPHVNLDNNDIIEKVNEEDDEVSIIYNKICKYSKYYRNCLAIIRDIDNRIEGHNKKVTELENKFNNHEDMDEDPESLYNNLIDYMKEILDKMEKYSDYFSIIDLIDSCISSINGKKDNNNEELSEDMYKIGHIILPYLKDKYHSYYQEKILELFENEKRIISEYLDSGLNNLINTCNKPKYNNTLEFDRYIWRLLDEKNILIEIRDAFKDETYRRNIAKEIMKETFEKVNTLFLDAKLSYINVLINMLGNLLKDIDKKIVLSPFSDSFNKDKETIENIRRHIEEFYSLDDLAKYIMDRCDNLRKYSVFSDNGKKDEINNLFLELLKLSSESIEYNNKVIEAYNKIEEVQQITVIEDYKDNKEPIKYNSECSETDKIIRALKSLIKVLNLLDLEITDSIKKKDVFKKCLIKVGKN